MTYVLPSSDQVSNSVLNCKWLEKNNA